MMTPRYGPGRNGSMAAADLRPNVQGIPDAGGESVQRPLTYEQPPFAPLVLQIASVADDILPWGHDQFRRDFQLRSFWPTESILASAIYSIVARNAAFSWTLEGPRRTVTAVQDILHMADGGDGWQAFIQKVCTDLLTQDNGAFIEIIRRGPGEDSPVIGLAHLDAGRCRRTGVPDYPVVYTDRWGVQHKLRAWQVVRWAEFPSPVESMNGVGLCAVSRVLRFAQLLRDIAIYHREKVGGRNPQALYLVSGVSTQMIDDAVTGRQVAKDAAGIARFMLPVVIGSMDPTATVKVDKVDLAGLPDGFDFDVMMRWYITQLAMGFGADYQDFAPMSLGGLGSSAQSLVLHMKSRGKGPALFMKAMEYRLNFHGVLPKNVTFKYDEQDAAGDLEQAELRKARAEARKLDIESGVLTPEAGRQQMLDDGDLSPEVFDAMQTQPDLTQDVTADDNDRREADTGGPGSATEAGPAQAAKAAEKTEASDFAEEERTAWEAEYRDVMERALRRAFAPLRRDILDAASVKALGLRLGKKDEEDVARAVGDAFERPAWWQEFRLLMLEQAAPTFQLVALGAAEFNATLGLPVNMDAVNQRVLDVTRTYTDTWWGEIETATRNAMRTALTNWQEGGLGSRGLPDLVDALEPWFGEARAERIAVTEVTRMFDIGNRLAHLEAGIEWEEWQTVKDERVCPVCRPLDGKQFPIDEGPRPPAHVRCRCSRLPVASDEVIGGRRGA